MPEAPAPSGDPPAPTLPTFPDDPIKDEVLELIEERYGDHPGRLDGASLPTTDADVAYGTPDMAREFARLYAECGFDRRRIAVMGGHEEGLISFGPNLQSAAELMLTLAAPG